MTHRGLIKSTRTSSLSAATMGPDRPQKRNIVLLYLWCVYAHLGMLVHFLSVMILPLSFCSLNVLG